MKVKSTGLGKTQLTSHIDGFYIKEDGTSAVMVIESTEPVHWHIECDMGGDDLRHFARLVLKPRTLVSLLRLLVQGGEAKGFVMEKEKGGRRAGAAKKARAAAGDSATAATATVEAAPAVAAASATTREAEAALPAADASTAAAAAPPPLVSLQALREAEGTLRDGERGEREERRAERRRRREQAAQAQPTAG